MTRRLIAALMVLTGGTAVAQPPSDSAFVRWARPRAVSIARLDAAAIAPLRSRLAEARLIGVGESVHGVQQFVAFRRQFLEVLVRDHRVTALMMESGMPEAMAVDDYVAGRTDTIDFISAVSYQYGSYDEVQRAIRWLRDWNRGPGRAHPVRVYGIDLPGNAGSMVPTLVRLGELVRLDEPSNGAAVAEDLAILVPVAQRIGGPWFRPAAARYDSLSEAERAGLTESVRKLEADVRAGRWRSAERSRWAIQLATIAVQHENALRLGFYHPSNPRDVAMAANTEWVLERLPAGERAVLWAHNAHVQKVAIEGPAAPPGKFAPMGLLLAERLGAGYLSIGTSYGGPSVDSATAVVAGSVDAVLGAVAAAPFFLPLLPGSPDPGWLAAPHPIRFQTGHLLVAPAAAFDAIVYFGRVDPAATVPGRGERDNDRNL